MYYVEKGRVMVLDSFERVLKSNPEHAKRARTRYHTAATHLNAVLTSTLDTATSLYVARLIKEDQDQKYKGVSGNVPADVHNCLLNAINVKYRTVVIELVKVHQGNFIASLKEGISCYNLNEISSKIGVSTKCLTMWLNKEKRPVIKKMTIIMGDVDRWVNDSA